MVEARNTGIHPGRQNPPIKKAPTERTEEGDGGSVSYTKTTQDLYENTNS